MEIFNDFGWFFATRIRVIEADPDPADQNERDPNGSGSETLFYSISYTFLHPGHLKLWTAFNRFNVSIIHPCSKNNPVTRILKNRSSHLKVSVRKSELQVYILTYCNVMNKCRHVTGPCPWTWRIEHLSLNTFSNFFRPWISWKSENVLELLENQIFKHSLCFTSV